jgi:thiosulfate reductase cytochrome b subunit
VKGVYLHPLPLRIWHWANALTVIILIVTGSKLRMAGVALLPPHSSALLLHKYAGWAMTVSSVFWLGYSLIGGHLARHYAFRRKDLRGIFAQTKFYLLTIFRGEENPFRPSPEEKFNPLQKLAYGAVMCIFTAVLVLTGVLLGDIALFRKYLLLLNIVGILDAIHVVAAYLFALYLIVHIYMSTLGSNVFSHIKEMIVGYVEEPETETSDFRRQTSD